MNFIKTYGLQKETRNYLRRLYSYGRELAAEDIDDIDGFVKGMKAANLWGFLKEGWLFREQQNIGTGSLILSIFGKYDATMMNSPTWGNDGILFTVNNQYINLDTALAGEKQNLSSFSNFCILNVELSNHNSQYTGLLGGSYNNMFGVYFAHIVWGPFGNRALDDAHLTSFNGGTTRRFGSANNPVVGVGYHFASAGRSDVLDVGKSIGYTEFNNVRTESHDNKGTLPKTLLGSRTTIHSNLGSSRRETSPGQFWFNKYLTPTDTLNLRAIYRNTLGRGLNLPSV